MAQSREKFESGKPLIVSLSADLNEEGAVRATVQNVEYLADVISKISETAMIYVENPSCLPRIKQALDADKNGRGTAIIVVKAGDYQVEIKLPNGYALSSDTIGALNSIPGISQIKQI